MEQESEIALEDTLFVWAFIKSKVESGQAGEAASLTNVNSHMDLHIWDFGVDYIK